MTPREERFAAWKARPGRPTLVALLEASQDRVFAICQDVLRDRHDAEEAAQETLLKIVSGLDDVTGPEHFERWTVTVASRTALDRKRSRNRRRTREFQGALRRSDGAHPCEGLHEAIAQLPEEDRALILERFFDGRTFDEMGKSRGMSDAAVRKRVEKARERLKRMLGCAIPVPFWRPASILGAAAVKTKVIAVVALLVVAFILGWVAFQGPRASTPAVAKVDRPPGPAPTGTTHRVPESPPPGPATPEPAPDAVAGKPSWKTVPPEIAGMPSGLIPVDGKRRCPYQILVNILGDHSKWWGADADEMQRRQRMILGVGDVDQQLLKAWGGAWSPDGPHEKGEISDPATLAAFLMDVYEGNRKDIAGIIERGVHETYGFLDPASAARGRALALLANFPEDPAVIDFMRRRASEAGRPDVQGLAAAGLVRLGQDAGVLDLVRGDPETLRVFLASLSLGTWEGTRIEDPVHLGSGFAHSRAEEMGPQLTAGLIDLASRRGDRSTFLAAVRVLSLASPGSPGHQAVTPLWEEARTDPELAVILMETRFNWHTSPRAAQVLNELALGENPRLALLATSQLWPLTDATSVATLVSLLGHEDPRRVRAAAMSLGGGGAAHADLVLPALKAVIDRKADDKAVEQAKDSYYSIRRRLKERAK